MNGAPEGAPCITPSQNGKNPQKQDHADRDRGKVRQVVVGVTFLPRGLHDIVHDNLLLRPGFPGLPRLYPSL
jgi:hypothetical protein